MRITIRHKLLTGFWAAEVGALQTTLQRVKTDRSRGNDCQVVLFEVFRGGRLHANVTHKRQTKSVPGWAGPASLPQGFVHNRTFSAVQPTRQIVRQVRDMIFAAAV